MFLYSYVNYNPSWSSRLSCQFFSNRCDPLQIDPITSTFPSSILSSPNGVRFIRPKLSLFSHPPTLFLQGLRFLNQVSILFTWSPFILFNQCAYPVVLMKMLFKFTILRSIFSSGGFKSSFRCWSYHFLWLTCFPCWKFLSKTLLFTHLSLSICSGVLKISRKICVAILNCSRYLEVVISFKPFNSAGASLF